VSTSKWDNHSNLNHKKFHPNVIDLQIPILNSNRLPNHLSKEQHNPHKLLNKIYKYQQWIQYKNPQNLQDKI
jgi:hypothetical protein